MSETPALTAAQKGALRRLVTGSLSQREAALLRALFDDATAYADVRHAIVASILAARTQPEQPVQTLEWSARQHREDAKLVQSAMQRIAERRLNMNATHRQPPVYVPIEDASDLLMVMHRDGIYRSALADKLAHRDPKEPSHECSGGTEGG